MTIPHPLSKPIAKGRTAEIYTWQDDQVLKLFFDWFSLSNIEYEQHINRAVHASGLPVPAVGEIIQVNQRNGLLYERIKGGNMWDAIIRKPWRLSFFARRLAELHCQMHSSILSLELPPQRRRILSKINHTEDLPGNLRSKVLEILAGLPDGERLCHGDFHPGNILVTDRSEVIIDWIDASRGNPLADVGRTTIIALGSAGSPQVKNIIEKAVIRKFHAVYLAHYFELRPGSEDEYRRWLPVVAAARLEENIPEVKQWLLAQVEKGCSEISV